MNLFVTSYCPTESAKYLDDKRVVKMTLETAQLLSSAIILNGGSASYKATHKHHPVTVWTAKNKANYKWALRHFCALSREYTRRYNKVHKSSGLIKEFIKGIDSIPDGAMTKFANCAANKELGVSYKHMQDITTAYKLYLNDRWDNDKRQPTWK